MKKIIWIIWRVAGNGSLVRNIAFTFSDFNSLIRLKKVLWDQNLYKTHLVIFDSGWKGALFVKIGVLVLKLMLKFVFWAKLTPN